LTRHARKMLDEAWAAAEQLPPELRRQLSRRLQESTADATVVLASLRRLPPLQLRRLSTLMDKNEDGRLTRAERRELEELGREADELMLENSRAIATALGARPARKGRGLHRK